MVGGGDVDVLHDQSIFFSELRLDARLGITDAFSVDLVVPVRVIDMGIVYRDLASGDPVTLQDPDIHHRDETLVGVFDPWLLGGYSWRRDRLRLGAKLGTTIPIGKTEEDPFALGDMDLEHQHIQFGSGIFAPIIGAEARYDLAGFSVAGQVLAIASIYESGKGYQPGDRYIAGLSARSKLGTETWTFGAGGTFQAETAERWNGARRTDEGNQGRIDFLVGLEIARRVGERFVAHAAVQVPVYNRVVGGQLDYPAIAQLGLTASFDLFGGAPGGHDHDDGHDHGDDEHDDEHDDAWRGVDMVEIAKSGEAVALEPVAGKVTVFDFWAPWCEPCKELDHQLAALARRHPGKLAIRKINIVDWNSDAAIEFLRPGGFNLPHVKVYGPGGERAFEKSGDPTTLAAGVELLLKDVDPDQSREAGNKGARRSPQPRELT